MRLVLLFLIIFSFYGYGQGNTSQLTKIEANCIRFDREEIPFYIIEKGKEYIVSRSGLAFYQNSQLLYMIAYYPKKKTKEISWNSVNQPESYELYYYYQNHIYSLKFNRDNEKAKATSFPDVYQKR